MSQMIDAHKCGTFNIQSMKSPHMVMTFHEDYYRIQNLSNQSKLVCNLICSWFLTMPRGRFQTKATCMQLICSWLVYSNAKRRKIRMLCSLILTMPIGKFAHFAAYYQNYPVTNTELIAIMHGYHGALIHHVNLCFHFSAWVYNHRLCIWVNSQIPTLRTASYTF
jgi:hypothetical protein